MLEKRNFPAQIERVVGGELNVGGFFNGNVITIKDRERNPEAQKGLRSVSLVEEKRLGQQK